MERRFLASYAEAAQLKKESKVQAQDGVKRGGAQRTDEEPTRAELTDEL